MDLWSVSLKQKNSSHQFISMTLSLLHSVQSLNLDFVLPIPFSIEFWNYMYNFPAFCILDESASMPIPFHISFAPESNEGDTDIQVERREWFRFNLLLQQLQWSSLFSASRIHSYTQSTHLTLPYHLSTFLLSIAVSTEISKSKSNWLQFNNSCMHRAKIFIFAFESFMMFINYC